MVEQICDCTLQLTVGLTGWLINVKPFNENQCFLTIKQKFHVPLFTIEQRMIVFHELESALPTLGTITCYD